MTDVSPARPPAGRVRIAASGARSLLSTGIVRPYGPRKIYGLLSSLLRWGTGLAGGYAALAARMPGEIGIVDELGPVTFGRIHAEANAIARELAARGVREGDAVALLARNHRWFVETSIAVQRLGADVLYLNTAFSGPQIVGVLERDTVRVLVHDDEFAPMVTDLPEGVTRLRAWDEGEGGDAPTVADVVERHSGADLTPPSREGRSIILTSGTTGAPKGASRGSGGLDAAAALASRMPLRHRWSVHIAAPLFHTWGWGHLNLGLLIGSTLVLRRRFDPEDFLATVDRHRCEAAVVIPVMMQRVLALPPEQRARYDLSSLQVVAASGSALPGELATDWMDAFGDNLYNIYGSTECAWATIAQPAEMRARPGTAGRPPVGTTLLVVDEQGSPVPDGTTGRIFVENSMLFEGYTGGGDKARLGSAMATGDVGHLDGGLLFVEGRDDDMIVSGGENVFPQEVEDSLLTHAAVVDAAAVGVPDDEFGQRLRAFVVLAPGASADEAELQEHVKNSLARYKVPREIVTLDELPRNATGKILKRELARYGTES